MEPSQTVAGLADCNPAQDCGNSVLDKLRAREAQRTADAARRLEALHGSADPQESVEAFLERYGAERCELTAAVQAATSGADATAAREGLDALTARVAALEGDVAKASYFLPPYDLRQATLGVTALKEQVEAAVAALQPRKKFSFRNKVSAAVAVAAASTPAAVPASVAEAAPSGKTSFSAGCAIRGLRGQSIVLRGGEVAGQDYTLSDLEDCTICLLGPLAALFMHGLRRCHVVAGPVAGATFMEGVHDSRLYVAARQVRVHSAAGTDLYLRVLSHPIIEHSSALRFAPFQPSYPGSAADLEAHGLGDDATEGKWAEVDDFGWLRASASPHWAVLPEPERQPPPLPAQ